MKQHTHLLSPTILTDADFAHKSVDELKEFKECALCGTAAVLSPVGRIDNHQETILLPSGMNGTDAEMKVPKPRIGVWLHEKGAYCIFDCSCDSNNSKCGFTN